MEYSIDGKNVIWENPEEFGRTYPITNEWHNYGGYKTWLAPQTNWGWPPDPMLDFGKANVEVIHNPNNDIPELKITGAASLASGIIFTKEISLNDSGEVLLRQRMKNIGNKTVSYSLWDVTQMQTPCFVVFPVRSDSKFPGGISFLDVKSKNSKQFCVKKGLSITRYMGEVGKIGSDSGEGWMAWIKGDLAYIKQFTPMLKRAKYPDDGCTVEVFTQESKFGYVEMEVMGPMAKLSPGMSTEVAEKWRLMKLPHAIDAEDQAADLCTSKLWPVSK